jgi:hypothetical protein
MLPPIYGLDREKLRDNPDFWCEQGCAVAQQADKVAVYGRFIFNLVFARVAGARCLSSFFSP